MALNPLDLVSAAPWRSAAFTTYALSLSFFEAVVLDRLIRGGGQSALILADPEGVRSGLSEEGARRAGRDYDIEPVACVGGVFHPKLSGLASIKWRVFPETKGRPDEPTQKIYEGVCSRGCCAIA
jgi:hypothetical protein